MTLLPRVRVLMRRHPWLTDVAVVVGVFVLLMMTIRFARNLDTSAWLAILGLPMSAALAFRRRWPVQVLAVDLALLAVLLVADAGRQPLDPIIAVAAFNVAVRRPRRTTWIMAVLSAAVVTLVNLRVPDGDPLLQEILGPVFLIGMATAVGDAIRSRRAYVAAVEERARQAEAGREEEAERRVMAERLRIARELHDVLAHHIALINVQAQVAAHVLDSAPAQAHTALGHVRDAGREALDELRTTVGLLRAPGGGEELLTAPSPGLDGLPGLLASFTAAGTAVTHVTEGEPRPLSAQVGLTAFRIAQEALTNVHKHAPGARATVRIGYLPGDLLVEITDDGPGGATLGTGNGLIGMRERALSVEGTFTAGPGPDGGFRVRAVLPAPQEGK